MSFRAVLLMGSFLVAGLLVAQNAPPVQTASGTGANVDEAGPFFAGNDKTRAEREKIAAEVRGFLWYHLQARRAGRVQATFYTIEGDPTTQTFTIELDETGEPSLHDQIVWIEAALLRPRGKKPIRHTEVEKFCEVQRIDADTEKLLPPQESRDAQSFRLRLKDCKTGRTTDF